MHELIKSLVETNGPSGFEEKVRKVVEGAVAGLLAETSVDALGNLIARYKGDGSGQKIMIAAHMDEIGVMATHITEKGFLRFTNIGGFGTNALVGAQIQFLNGIVGVIAAEKAEPSTKVQSLDKHYIDVGASAPENCPVEVGMAGAFVGSFRQQETRLIGKSMDDRIGCTVLIETLRRLDGSPHDLYFVFSTQEEVGTRGAQTVANTIQPDIGLAVDVTWTGDTPGSRDLSVAVADGPAIKVKDAGMIAHVGLVRHMRSTAEKAEIPYQLEVIEGGTTDARSMQIAGSGCAAGCISIPCRYVHTRSEVVDINDVENGIRLLTALLSNPVDL